MSGVLHGVVASLKAAAAAVTDAFFKYVSLLANTTSTNGAQNNTFLDGSTNAFSITRNGNTTQGNFSPFSQTGWSNYFDGNGDYFTVANNAALNMGANSFTLEAFIYLTATPGAASPYGGVIIDKDGLSGTSWPQYALSVDSNRKAVFQASSVPNVFSPTAVITGATTLALGTWYHIAVTRVGTAATLWVNGISDGTTSSVPATLNSATRSLFIGWTDRGAPDATYNFPGYISNLRIVNGTAVYTATFTPPTAPLTAITNTSLLTCQSNRFIDNSSNNFTITRNGDTSVQAFSPFNPTAAWSASTNGGSGYFDGTGDYLTAAMTALSFGTGNFTIEGWVYRLDTNTRGVFQLSSTAGGLQTSTTNTLALGSDAGQVWRIYANGTAYNSTATWVTGAWYHFALVRNSGTTTLYINGTSVISQADTTNYTGVNIAVSGFFDTTFLMNGYISGVRVLTGTAQYTANFTPPTAPLTAITNTSLLLNFTNAGIFDGAGANNFETSGNAQASTTQAKFGTTSMKFAGGSDWMQTVTKPALRFGTAPFTIEAWLYPTSAATMCVASIYTGTAGWNWKISGNVIAWYDNTSGNIGGTAAIASNTWTHVAIVREGTGANQFKFYVNGVLDVTSTCSANFTQTANCFVGGEGGAAPNFATNVWNGYIDDLRITNGYARYTANFTPPTAAFPLN